MKNLFHSPMRVTLPFADKYNGYYAKYGLDGHNGLDSVPTEDDWSVLSVMHGQVVRSTFHPTLGNIVVVVDWRRGEATWYCHLESRNVESGDLVDAGDVLGIMGGTPNFVPHLHFMYCQCDRNGFRLNKENGFAGMLDPMTYLGRID